MLSQTCDWFTWKNGLIIYLVPKISYLSQAILIYSHLLYWFSSVEVRVTGEKLRWVSYYYNQRFKAKNSMKCHGNPKLFSKRKCVTSSMAKNISTWIQYVLSLCCKLIAHRWVSVFLGSLFCSVDLCVCFCVHSTLFSLLWLWSIVWNMEELYFQLWSLSQDHFAIMGLFWVHINIKSIYPSSVKNMDILILSFNCSVMFNSSWLHGLQHARFPCPSLSPGVCSNSCP